ncbi:PLD nuclease N-terminal domain-containing protein [Nocardioidaceae bacterium SCSIO 66511]|nr:PLD nuclease N-terminal domain-containing protein [Nocardioidaceae bacterium SCSIO 66511]
MGKALLVIAVLVMTIFAFYDVLATPRGATRRLPKWVWAVAAFVPVIGPLLWFIIGRPRRRRTPPPRQPRRSVSGPDDDPDFLRDLNRNPEDVLEEWEKEYRRKRRAHGEDPER